MPVWSEDRQVYLLNSFEVAEAWGITSRWAQKQAGKPGVYSEKRTERGGRGTLYFDPATLEPLLGPPKHPLPVPSEIDVLPAEPAELTVAAAPPPLPVSQPSPHPANAAKRPLPDLRHADPEELAWAGRVQTLARQLEALPRGAGRTRLVGEFAQSHGVTLETAYGWLRELEERGAAGLLRLRRADRGRSRIPEELQQILISLWLHHPQHSAGRIRRLLELADPELLRYRRGRTTYTLSVRAVRDVRKRMERDPRFRVALMNEDERREFLRTWAGRVVASHANELWEADFTRCDSMVFSLKDYAKNRKVVPFRLRIHATIDVFSGAVPSFVFSRLESLQPTKRMLILALHPKVGVWAERWPVYGRPKRIYWDNGKVYTAEDTERALQALGIEYTHSRAWISHTRGKIERFFETFHKSFEAGLKSYAGEDASQRNNWELARLAEVTQRWLDKGANPEADPWPDRLPTEDEYMWLAHTWLVSDYHNEIGSDGKTRLERFLETAPPSSLVQWDAFDLLKIFSRQEVRVVAGNGTVRYGNRFWTLPDGGLMAYQGREVVVLEAEHPLTGEPMIWLTLPQPDGTLAQLGQAVEVDGAALSQQNRELRQASTLAAKALLEDAEALRQRYLDPTWRQDSILRQRAELPVQPLKISLPGPKATLAEAKSPKEQAQEFLAQGNPFFAALASMMPIQPSPGRDGDGEKGTVDGQ